MGPSARQTAPASGRPRADGCTSSKTVFPTVSANAIRLGRSIRGESRIGRPEACGFPRPEDLSISRAIARVLRRANGARLRMSTSADHRHGGAAATSPTQGCEHPPETSESARDLSILSLRLLEDRRTCALPGQSTWVLRRANCARLRMTRRQSRSRSDEPAGRRPKTGVVTFGTSSNKGFPKQPLFREGIQVSGRTAAPLPSSLTERRGVGGWGRRGASVET